MALIKRHGNRVLLVCLGSVVLYQLFFLGFIIFFHGELSYSPLKPPSYEEWGWLIGHPEAINDRLLKMVSAATSVMNLVYLLSYLYVLSSKEFARKMKKWQIAAAFLAAYAVHWFCNYFILNYVSEYRMYMDLIPTELISLLLLFFILMAMKEKDGSST